jgi:zinc protease
MKRIVPASLGLVLLAACTLRAGPPEPWRLDNGLTVLLRPVPDSKQVAVVLLFNLGADHDPAGGSGTAHLLEHLYCTAAAGDAPARDFAQIQKRYGSGYNQQTGADFTVFAGVVPAGALEEELGDAAARLGALRIVGADLEREVPRVLAELQNMYGGIPSLAGINHVRAELHPIGAGGRFGGAATHVQAVRLDALQKLWQDYYKPSNAALVLAGGFDEAKTRETIRRRFGPIPAGLAPPAKPPRPGAETGKTLRIRVKPVVPGATGVAAVGYAAPLPGSRDYAPFLLAVSRLMASAQGAPPGPVPPLYYPMLDDPATIALQAPLTAGEDAEAVLNHLDQRLQAALAPELRPQDTMQALQGTALLGTVDLPDTLWAQNLYGLAFGVGRRHQLKIDGGELRAAIQRVTGDDVKRLASGVFAAANRVAVVVEAEPEGR